MNIALDWDNTFTRDYDFWQQFCTNLTNRFYDNIDGYNHGRVWIVTARSEDTPIEATPTDIEGIVYCNYRAKRKVCEEREIPIEIWIDDQPELIIEGFVE